MWLGIVGGCEADPAVAFHLMNAADYRLPTFGPHGTKLGHYWYQWITKSDFSGCFDNSKKGEVSGQNLSMGADPVVALRLRNAAEYRLPTFGPHGTKLGHSWYQWIKIKVIFLAGLTILKKEEVSEQIEWMGVWSRGCTPPKECCRLPPTYFWTTWHQTRAFLISVNNKKWFVGLVWQFWKRRGVWADWMDGGLIPWLHST